jgi:ComF family protein
LGAFSLLRRIMDLNISRRILHILYPTKCPVCGDFIGYNDGFCTQCECQLVTFEGEFNIPDADGFCAAFIYDENISPAIMLMKDGIIGNADFALGHALTEKLKATDFINDFSLIIPVPMHKKDLRRRTCNQSELIAKQIGKRLGIPVCSKAVAKIRLTKSQKTLTRNERMVNLKDAFSVVHPELIENKNILLIDDVCTTGSTLAELTQLLKNNHAGKVYCASCCKTPNKVKEETSI